MANNTKNMASDKSNPSLFTPKQKTSLAKEGFNSIFQIITYFPYKYVSVKPIDQQSRLNEGVYLLTGIIESVERRKNHYVFYVAQADTGIVFSGYYFVNARFVMSSYKVGTAIQAEVQSRKGFLTFKRIVTLKQQRDNSMLGKREDISYIQPVYSKKGVLNNKEWSVIHSKIPEESYILDLTDLVKNGGLIATHINLLEAHKPKNTHNVTEILDEYNKLRLYLKLVQNYYAKLHSIEKLARSSQKQSQYLTTLTQSLPYTLSNSQKLTIWEIITHFAE